MNERFLALLAQKYPSVRDVCTELINLQAILNLPKGTEHFMSDLHGEYDAFCHILNNCAGVVKEKVRALFPELTEAQAAEFCSLLYYPAQKLELLHRAGVTGRDWYTENLNRMIALAASISSKYTRSKVRKAMPKEYSYILDELLHAQRDEDDNQQVYHKKILETLIEVDNADDFILALASLIKQLAVDRVHIVGDIFDRGPRPDEILNQLMGLHAVDVQWGNHDALWMGAAAGSRVCCAGAVRNSLHAKNTDVLEKGYGIPLLHMMQYYGGLYPGCSLLEAAEKGMTLLMFKEEAALIRRRPEFGMEHRLLLQKTFENQPGTPLLAEKPLMGEQLTQEEEQILQELVQAFGESSRLNRQVRFLYANGSLYKCFNGNLLFHGCMPVQPDGSFYRAPFAENRSGKDYFDWADKKAREAYFANDPFALDFMWYLWCGEKSPLCGRKMRTFERAYWKNPPEEENDPYYSLLEGPELCERVLAEFGLTDSEARIVSGHTPVRVCRGESPVKAGGRLVIIDGGFCKAYQSKTGIAGYTLISNSHCLRIVSHQPFCGHEEALRRNTDVESMSRVLTVYRQRKMVYSSDTGKELQAQIEDLKTLLAAYRSGELVPRA